MTDGWARSALVMFRFIAWDTVRSRRLYLASVWAAITVLSLMMALRSGSSALQGVGFLFVTGLWALSAPFCRSWIDIDTRGGQASLWLQRPIGVAELYSGRMVALLAWALLINFAVTLAVTPAIVVSSIPNHELLDLPLAFGWLPVLLVSLSFAGSALGARNSALFAYGMVACGFAVPALEQVVQSNEALLGVLRLILPPVEGTLSVMQLLDHGQRGRAVVELWPMLVYSGSCGVLGVLLALGVPLRLARWR